MTVVTEPLATGSPAPKRRRGRRLSRLTRTDKIVLFVMCGIPTLLLIAFVWFPALSSVGLSFTSWDGIGGLGTIKWVGTQNYHQIFTIYPPFWPALRHNVIWLAFFILLPTTFGVFLAVLLDKQIRFSRLYQSTLYLPVMLSLALVGFIAQLFYSQDQGLINGILGKSGTGPDILGDPKLNLWAILIAASWRHTGYIMVLYLAGLKSVDPSLRDAAQIDGATEWQTFRRVIFPVMRPINVIVLVVTVIESLRGAFDIVYVVNGGKNGLELLSVLVYDNIVGEASRIGYGSALGVILLVISLGFIVTYLFQNFRKEQRG
jgi:multiple sugar transport system permease protein